MMITIKVTQEQYNTIYTALLLELGKYTDPHDENANLARTRLEETVEAVRAALGYKQKGENDLKLYKVWFRNSLEDGGFLCCLKSTKNLTIQEIVDFFKNDEFCSNATECNISEITFDVARKSGFRRYYEYETGVLKIC